MAAHINFEAKTDRELLLLVASQTNTLAETCVPAIESRLAVVEAECKRRAEVCGSGPQLLKRRDKIIMTSGAGAGGLALIGLLAELITRLLSKGG